MLRAVLPMSGLLLGMGIMLLGNGLFGTLAALRMTIEGFSPVTIGVVVACHSIGFAAACLTCQRIINAVGQIRVFAAFAALLAATSLCMPLMVAPLPWILLRLIFGYSSAAVFMVGESWLAGSAPSDMKGKVFALYMVVNKACFGIGQLLLNLADPAGDRLFMMTAILYALCLIPIALKRTGEPRQLGSERLSFAALYRLSPVGVIGAVGAGSVNSPLIGLGPVFAAERGLSVAEISLFMAAFLAGSLMLQIPIGRLSDRFDRRTVLMAVALATSASCAAMAQFGDGGFPVLLLLSAAVGGLSATIYPIAMTHANDLGRPQQTVSLHAGLLLAFSMGASTGPVVASIAMEQFGPSGLFGYAAVVDAILAGFIAYRMIRRPPAPEEMQGDFVAMPQIAQTTPVVGALDPRTDAADGGTGQ